MALDGKERRAGCPRCGICNAVIRTREVDWEGALCKDCISGALPFVGIVSESEFKVALKEYMEGLQSKASQFDGLRLTRLMKTCKRHSRD